MTVPHNKDGTPTPPNQTELDEFVSAEKSWRLIKWVVGHSTTTDRQIFPVNECNAESQAQSIAAGIASENKHIENRVQWNLALQGFLYASYAIAVSAEKTPYEVRKQFVTIISSVGLWSCGITALGIYAAYRSINIYKKFWLSNYKQLIEKSAPPFSHPVPSFLGRLPATLMVLGVAWFFLVSLSNNLTENKRPDAIELYWKGGQPTVNLPDLRANSKAEPTEKSITRNDK